MIKIWQSGKGVRKPPGLSDVIYEWSLSHILNNNTAQMLLNELNLICND